MRRVIQGFLAVVAVLAIGAVGAGAASAASGNATISIVGSGSCDVTFTTNGWTNHATTPASWSTTVSNITVATGGTCDVKSVSGSGTLTKWADGTTTFQATNVTITATILFFDQTCVYDGSMSGYWYWTAHGTQLIPDPTMNGSPAPGTPPATNPDKFFHLTGTGDLQDESPIPGLCPNPVDLEMVARTHEH